MAEKELKCPKCDRSFSMAAHLARHVNATHARKTAKRVAKKRKAAKKRKTVKKRKAVKKRRKVARKPAPKRKVKRKVGRRKVRRKVARAKAGRRPVRRQARTGAAGLISQMRAHQRQLSARQAELQANITAITAAIEAMGAAAAPTPVRRRRRRRAPRGIRAGSLKDFITRVLRQSRRPLGPKQLAASVVRAGYKTRAGNLATLVSNALGQMTGVKKAGRGLYRL